MMLNNFPVVSVPPDASPVTRYARCYQAIAAQLLSLSLNVHLSQNEAETRARSMAAISLVETAARLEALEFRQVQ